MKEKTALIVCGNSGLDYFEHNNIEILRSTLNIEGKEYEDYVDLSAELFYKKLRENSDLKISTSQTALGIIVNKYEELIKKGFTECLVITLSSELSGTYSAFNQAKELVQGINVTIYDSRTVSYIEGYMALIAREKIKEGYKISEIIPMLDYIRDNNKILFLVDNIKFLVKNGRLSVAKGLCATLLKIKPLLTVVDGKVVPLKKIRTKEKAHNTLVEDFIKVAKGKKIQLIGLYTDNYDIIKATIDMVKGELDVVDTIYAPIAPVIGVHIGFGAYALAYIEVKENGQ